MVWAIWLMDSRVTLHSSGLNGAKEVRNRPRGRKHLYPSDARTGTIAEDFLPPDAILKAYFALW